LEKPTYVSFSRRALILPKVAIYNVVRRPASGFAASISPFDPHNRHSAIEAKCNVCLSSRRPRGVRRAPDTHRCPLLLDLLQNCMVWLPASRPHGVRTDDDMRQIAQLAAVRQTAKTLNLDTLFV
jgi:hypothetical protein